MTIDQLTEKVNAADANNATKSDGKRRRSPNGLSETNGTSRLRFDDQEAQRYLNLLGANENVWIETHDDSKERKNKALTATKQASRESVGALCGWIGEKNTNGAGIFTAVNEIDGTKRTKANVVRVRAIFGEFDNGLHGKLPLRPTFIVESSPGKYHYYWVLSDHLMTLEEFAGVMARMVADYGSDPNAKDVTRLLRVPGTWHMKNPDKPFQVRITKADGPTYTRDEILKAFPPRQRRKTGKQVEKIKANALNGTTSLKLSVDEAETVREVAQFLDRETGGDEWHNRDTWLRWGMALHHESDGSDEAYELWAELSRTYSPEKFDGRDQRDKWDSFGDYSGEALTLQSIYARAKKLGWRPTFIEPVTWPETTKDGKPRQRSQENIRYALDYLGVDVWKDEFSQRFHVVGFEKFDELDDEAMTALRLEADKLGLQSPPQFFVDVVRNTARQNSRHPLKEELAQLASGWDGKSRIGRLFPDYSGAEDTELNREIGLRWMIALIRRVRQPGVKFDQLLVLIGDQGVGKSTFGRTLVGDEYFTDNLTLGTNSKETIELMSSRWLGEISELQGLRRETELIKSMLSRQEDEARLAYDRTTTRRPRQWLPIGTTNSDQFSSDVSGNRRYWPVTVGEINLEALSRDRDQLLGEAAVLESRGESLALPQHLWTAAAEVQAELIVNNPIHDAIADELRDHGGQISMDVLWKIVGMEDGPVYKRDPRTMNEIGRAMRALGWKKKRVREAGARVYVYVKKAEHECSFDYNEIEGVLRKPLVIGQQGKAFATRRRRRA